MEYRLPISSNRAEEKANEAWKDFIIPPKFNSLDFKSSGQTRVVLGGRGSGKTMLLKYLSFESEFSDEHTDIHKHALEHVGLYLRADTIFCKALDGDFFKIHEWERIFTHYVCCIVLHEIARSLKYIARSAYPNFTQADYRELRLDDSLSAYDKEMPIKAIDLEKYFHIKNIEFDSWVSNLFPDSERPRFYSFNFLKSFISKVQEAHPALTKYSAFVYVDEYENLLSYQKRIFNTYIKHGEKPLVFHFAMKRFVIEEDQSTIGNENIQEIHDYRHKDIEDLYDKEYDTFLSEIILYELKKKYKYINIDATLLKDESRVSERTTKDYQNRISNEIKKFFPNLSEEDLSDIAFEDRAIRKKVKSEIEKKLKERNAPLDLVDLFFSEKHKKATFVAPILVARKSTSIETLSKEYLDYKKEGSKTVDNWIQNNFIASLLFFYQKFSEKNCPIYAGFDRLSSLSGRNIRFMMELCYNSLVQQNLRSGDDSSQCSWESMAAASRETSEKFFLETKKCGKSGYKLHEFVKRLGAIFQIAQQRPTQSENEINHFGIKDGGESGLNEDDYNLLIEALKHSVLTVRRETKVKRNDYYSQDYILSPIFAPYFKISYRKKRKLDLPVDDFYVISHGTPDEFNELLAKYRTKWDIDREFEAVTDLNEQGSLDL